MLKYKSKKFNEVAHVSKKKTVAVASDAELGFLAAQFETRLTFARLQAVKSKLSSKNAKNRQFLSNEMYQDVVDDIETGIDENVVQKAKKPTVLEQRNVSRRRRRYRDGNR